MSSFFQQSVNLKVSKASFSHQCRIISSFETVLVLVTTTSGFCFCFYMWQWCIRVCDDRSSYNNRHPYTTP
ncbi:hypothetical protein Ccrd_010432 [Cynara cardunculus var. scolymus]|uniref:Uncharacterized protein n=1 Tax=Cynara cardunculus var. scolymus TaxID=59895 RepID=A0A118K6T6_CYNCS|nr:hypothetical protein Ccrd_010432 [Cynara cardunculus var. scolymus]